MTTERPKGTTFPKQQLEIVKYEAAVPYGTAGKILDRMNAKNLSLQEGDPLRDKPLRYSIFNADLKNHLAALDVGARFLADIEERERPDSDYGPDRSIVQVYQNGQPVSVKKGGGYGKSPEIIRLEHQLALELEGVKRRSIEGQTAIAQVGNMLTCPTMIDGEVLGINQDEWVRVLGKYWRAVEKSLDTFLEEPTSAPTYRQKPQNKPEAPPTVDQQWKDLDREKDGNEEPIKHVGDLFTKASKLDPPVGRAELLGWLGKTESEPLGDLQQAWEEAKKLSATKKT